LAESNIWYITISAGIIREKVMGIYLNKYLITFMENGERFLTVERREVSDVGFPTGFPKYVFFYET